MGPRDWPCSSKDEHETFNFTVRVRFPPGPLTKMETKTFKPVYRTIRVCHDSPLSLLPTQIYQYHLPFPYVTFFYQPEVVNCLFSLVFSTEKPEQTTKVWFPTLGNIYYIGKLCYIPSNKPACGYFKPCMKTKTTPKNIDEAIAFFWQSLFTFDWTIGWKVLATNLCVDTPPKSDNQTAVLKSLARWAETPLDKVETIFAQNPRSACDERPQEVLSCTYGSYVNYLKTTPQL